MITLIRGARVIRPDFSGFDVRDICAVGEYFGAANAASPDLTVDAAGLYLLPGMIDIHTHGTYSVGFAEPDADYSAARRWYAAHGITAVAPTLRTMPLQQTAEALKRLAAAPERVPGKAAFIGIHCEGPFISRERSGAMYPSEDKCSIENFDLLTEAASGKIRIMTIAPERENAASVIAHGASLGVRMSLGHTMASYAEAKTAIRAGARGATHLFNAMRPFDHREPGVIGAVLTEDGVTCELIADFIHSSPCTVRMAYRLKGADRLITVSDTGEVCGLGDGSFTVDGKIRIVKDGVCRNSSGKLAGSTCSVYDDAKNLLSIGIPLHEIAAMTSRNPAAAVGISDRYGAVSDGCYADFILVDEKLGLHGVYIGGKKADE